MIARLLEGGPQVLATGGGAFMNADTRTLVRAKGVSVWLKADFDVLMKRIKRRTDRPMLKTADPAATLRMLMASAIRFMRRPTSSWNRAMCCTMSSSTRSSPRWSA